MALNYRNSQTTYTTHTVAVKRERMSIKKDLNFFMCMRVTYVYYGKLNTLDTVIVQCMRCDEELKEKEKHNDRRQVHSALFFNSCLWFVYG